MVKGTVDESRGEVQQCRDIYTVASMVVPMQLMAEMPEEPVVMQMLQFHKPRIIKNCLTPAMEVNVKQTFLCNFASNSRG